MSPPITAFVDINLSLIGATATRFAFGALLGAFAHSVTANRQDGPYYSVAEVEDAGFTSVATPAINDWATIVFSQDDGVESILIGREDGADANLTATLNAIEAAGSDTWYITNIESRVDADIALAAAWIEARDKILIAQTDSADLLASVEPNIGNTLSVALYHRTALIYHDDDTEYLDGAWSSSGGGLDLDSPNGAGIWMYRELEGVPYDAITGTQATNVWGANANVYGRTKGLSFTSKGTMASGRKIDITTSLDWVKARVGESVLGRFVGVKTKIPYTNAGILDIVAAISDVLDSGVRNGHISPDIPFQIIVPDSTEIAASVKTTRALTIQAVFYLAGAIEMIVLNVNVSF
jgi:hypothetical protein